MMNKLQKTCGNKPGDKLTPEVIMKKNNLPKQTLAEQIVQLKVLIDENTNLLKQAAEEIISERSQHAKSANSIIKLQADLICSQKNNIEALEVSFDKKASEVVDKLSEKMSEMPTQSSFNSVSAKLKEHTNNTAGNESTTSVMDWSKLDFSSSITNAMTKSLQAERTKERKISEKRNNVMLFGVVGDRSDDVYRVLNELDVNKEDVVAIDCIKSGSSSYSYESSEMEGDHAFQKSNFRVTLAHCVIVRRALRNASRLKNCGGGYRNAYVTPDRTTEQLTAHRELVQKLKKKITEKPDRRWIIKQGKITDAGEFNED